MTKGGVVSQKKSPSSEELLEFLKEFDYTMEAAIKATPSWHLLFVLPSMH